MKSISALVDATLPEMLPFLDRSYTLFGHSMGSFLASAVVHRLADLGKPLRQHLLVFGRHQPHMSSPAPPSRSLSHDTFVAGIHCGFERFPPKVTEFPERVESLLPALGCDIKPLEAFRPQWQSPVTRPTTACGDTRNDCTPRAHLEAWQADTLQPLRTRMFLGDRFCLGERLDNIAEELRATLTPSAAAHALREARS
jgi:medium-chain acyl-[acyl-carrier-protein] hydrolase